MADGYLQLVQRINALVNDFQGSIAVLRTKVELQLQEKNLALQDQNLQLLRSVDKRSRSEAILQHTVEGLSVIVLAYYLSGLGNYVFKAMETFGFIANASVASGVFVPIALGLSFLLMYMGRRLIYKRSTQDSEE